MTRTGTNLNRLRYSPGPRGMVGDCASSEAAELGGVGPGGDAEGQQGERREGEARTDHRWPFFDGRMREGRVGGPVGRRAVARPAAAAVRAARLRGYPVGRRVIPLSAIFKMLDVRGDLEGRRPLDLLGRRRAAAGSR